MGAEGLSITVTVRPVADGLSLADWIEREVANPASPIRAADTLEQAVELALRSVTLDVGPASGVQS